MTGNQQKREAAYKSAMYNRWGSIVGALIVAQVVYDSIQVFASGGGIGDILWSYLSFSSIIVLMSYAFGIWGIANGEPPKQKDVKHSQSAIQLGQDDSQKDAGQLEFHDLVYVTAAAQILSNFVSWGKYVYVVVPLYVSYRATVWGYGKYNQVKQMASAMGINLPGAQPANDTQQNNLNKAQQKLKAKQEMLAKRQKGR